MDTSELLDDTPQQSPQLSAATAQDGQHSRLVKLHYIEKDMALQIRCQNDVDQIDNLCAAIEEGHDIPPVDLFWDETAKRYFIGDGWHRILAYEQRGWEDIPAIVHQGGRPAALKHALGANASHGLRRTNKDKRRAIEIATSEFPRLSNVAIAELCKVTDKTVARYRPQTEEKLLGKDGKERPANLPKQAPAQIDFWEVLRDDYGSALNKVRLIWRSDDFLHKAEEDPLAAAQNCEDIAANMRHEAAELKKMAEALRIGAQKNK